MEEHLKNSLRRAMWCYTGLAVKPSVVERVVRKFESIAESDKSEAELATLYGAVTKPMAEKSAAVADQAKKSLAELDAELRKTLRGFIGQPRSPATRRAMVSALERLAPGPECTVVSCTGAYDELPWHKRVWLTCFNRKEKRRLKQQINTVLSVPERYVHYLDEPAEHVEVTSFINDK